MTQMYSGLVYQKKICMNIFVSWYYSARRGKDKYDENIDESENFDQPGHPQNFYFSTSYSHMGTMIKIASVGIPRYHVFSMHKEPENTSSNC